MKRVLFIFLIIAIAISHSYASEIKVVFSRTTPPYVFDDGKGISFDIVKESLAVKNHTVKPIYVNIARGADMFRAGLADANSLVQEEHDGKGFYSTEFIEYRNKAYSLKNSSVKLEKMEDIKNYHTIGFQNAHLYLGKKFTAIAAEAGAKYSEQADQKQQVYLLYQGRAQVIVMDESIFRFYTTMLASEGKIEPDIEVVSADFFGATKYQVVFRDKQIRDDFNFGFKEITKNGTRKRIYDKYTKYYFEAKK